LGEFHVSNFMHIIESVRCLLHVCKIPDFKKVLYLEEGTTLRLFLDSGAEPRMIFSGLNSSYCPQLGPQVQEEPQRVSLPCT
jgi:hypothetical protein